MLLQLTIFTWPLVQITFKKISYYLCRIFKLVTHIFKKKFTSCWTEKYKLYKIPWHLRRSDARNKTLNKKDETQVNIKDLDAAIMFSTNVMNEQTENNKQTNCFLKIFIRKSITLPLKAIHVHTDWIVRIRFHKLNRLSTWQKLTLRLSVSDRTHFPIFLENSIKNI